MIRENMKLSEYLLYALLSILISFALCAVFIMIMGKNPLSAFSTMISGAFGNFYGICETIVRATPLILMGIGVSIAYKAGLMNLGGDGQFYLGAIASAMLGITYYGRIPTALLVILAVLASIVVGGIWGGIAGFCKARFGTNEIIVTLMMNYLALYFFRYLIEGPAMDPDVYLAQTAQVPESMRLYRIFPGMRVNISIFIVIAVVAVAAYVIKRTVWGYNIELLGNSPAASDYGGVNKSRYFMVLMFISGGLAGLAGFIEIYAIHFRGMEGITADFGFVAVIVALLANTNPIGVVIAGLFVAAIQIGANSMQVLQKVPSSISTVVQAIIIILLMIIPIIASNIRRKRIERKTEQAINQEHPDELKEA